MDVRRLEGLQADGGDIGREGGGTLVTRLQLFIFLNWGGTTLTL